MIKNLLILPDGTQLFSGPGTENAIKSVSLTKSVNSGEDLTIGSACAAMLEAELITPGGGLSLQPGDEVALYKVNADGSCRQEGIFILEQPVRQTANTMRLTGYDRMIRLDKDLTQWLKSLDGWPYDAASFAGMVCDACGVEFIAKAVPNGDYPIAKFQKNGVTGRQILKWLAELCCRFCRANADGKIEMDWYQPVKTAAIGPREDTFRILKGGNAPVLDSEEVADAYENGELTMESAHLSVTDDGEGNVVLVVDEPIQGVYYLQNGLQLEPYVTAPIDAVQISFAEDSESYRWPEAEENANCYVISGNPFLSSTTDAVKNALQTITDQLHGVGYTPCKVEVPANLQIDAGHMVTIQDLSGASIRACVMTKTTKGQKDTLECTGNHRRDSASAVNNPSSAEQMHSAVDRQLTQQELLRRLTQNGGDDAIYLKDGKLAIKATAILTGILQGVEIIGENGRIGGLTMTENSLTTTYRRDFSDYTQEDVARIQELYFSGEATSKEDLYRYDINMNGRIDASDAFALQQMLGGNLPAYTEGTITVDAKDPLRCVVLEVTGGYRAGEKTVIGMGTVYSDEVRAKTHFVCGGQNGYTGTLQLGAQTLDVAGGIIVNVE